MISGYSPRSATLKLPKRGGNGASQPPPSPLSFFRPHTYPKGTQRVPKGLPKGDYFSSSQSSSVIKKDGGFNNTNERRSRGRHQIPSAVGVGPFSSYEIYTRQNCFLLLYHAQMIFQAGNVRESLFNLKEKKIGMKGVRIGSGSLVLRRTSIPH